MKANYSTKKGSVKYSCEGRAYEMKYQNIYY